MTDQPADPANDQPTDPDDDQPGAGEPTSDVVAPDRAVDSQVFRHVMAAFATGVTVMTAMDRAGEVTGMTANAVASVSLDPLLVLVCVESTTDMAAKVASGERFALSVLAADQRHLSDHFANPSRSRGWEGFSDIPVTTARTGVPILAESLGWLDCVVQAIHPGGDHRIVVGEVVAGGRGGPGPALGWFDHGYVAIPRP